MMIREIQTSRLTVRPIVAEDWMDIKRIWESVNASAYAQYDMPHNTAEEDVQPRIARWAQANSGTEHLFFAVCLNRAVIGYVAFNIRQTGYEIGYCFHTDYHGKGYASESLRAVIADLRELGLTRFSARTALSNTPSVRLLTSLGFQPIGTEKVSFYKDSRGEDIVFEGGIFELALG